MADFGDSSSGDEETPFNLEDIESRTFEEQLPLWQRIKKAVGDRKNFQATLCYCGVFMVFGMSDEVLGPTLLELRCLTGKSLTIMSFIFFVHDLCNVFGSTAGGFLVDRFNVNLLLSIALGISAISMIAIPLCHVFVLMLLLAALYGGCFGATDTFTTVQLIRMYGKKVSPYLQSLHFCYGVGGFLSPLIARPFLRLKCVLLINYTTVYDEWPYANATGVTSHEFIGLPDNTSRIEFEQELVQRDSHVRWAYWIVAVAHIPVIFGLLWIMFTKKLEKVKGSLKQNEFEFYGSTNLSTPGYNHHIVALYFDGAPPWLRVFGEDQKPRVIVVTILASFILLLFDGLMASFGSYVYTYGIKGAVHMKPSHGAYLTSLFWGMLSLGRFISIPLAYYVEPPTMLLINLTGCLGSTFLMLCLEQSEPALWVGVAGVGLFMSSIFPTTIALAEYYIDLTAPVTSIMIVSAAMGELVIPLIVGQIFERLGPVSFLAIAFCVCFLGTLTYVLLRTVEGQDWLGFFWFVWCGQGTNATTATTGYPKTPPSPKIDAHTPFIDTVPLTVQG